MGAIVIALIIAACGGNGDNETGGNGGGADGGDGSGRPSASPYIPPPSYAADEALARLAEIEAMVRQPNGALVALARVDDAILQERITRILNGDNENSGLDDVRRALETDDRILAGEYLYNTAVQYASPTLSEHDRREIEEATLDEIDVNHTFDSDHSDGMSVSAVFADALIAMIELWYRI